MNWGQALNAMDTGERVRFRGIPCIIAGVEVKRMSRIHNETHQPYCIGDKFVCSARADRAARCMKVGSRKS